MKICPECGCENADNVNFCKNCGFEIKEDELNSEHSDGDVCPNCGQKVDEGMKFCMNCGEKLIHEQKTDNKIKFCPYCGAELNKNVKFCPDCGKSIVQQPEVIQNQVTVKSKKSPILALILSFFIPGLGQIYLGLGKKGIILFFLAIIVGGILALIYIGFIIYFVVWFYSMFDGYNSAQKINNGIEVEDNLDMNNLF